MKRRDFVRIVATSATVWPLVARAQQSRIARIGALYIGTADADSFKKELREGLRELGYVEGQNIAFEFRSADGQLDRLPGLAAELVRLKNLGSENGLSCPRHTAWCPPRRDPDPGPQEGQARADFDHLNRPSGQ